MIIGCLCLSRVGQHSCFVLFFAFGHTIARAPGSDLVGGGVEKFSVVGGGFPDDEDGVVTPGDVCFPA